MALIYLLFVAVVFYWQARAARSGKITKGKAIGLYAGYTIAPIVLYGAVFLTLVGVEEFTNAAIIGEGYSRSLLFVIAGGMVIVLLTTFVFSLAILAMKTGDINGESIGGDDK